MGGRGNYGPVADLCTGVGIVNGHRQIIESRQNQRKPKAIFFELGRPTEPGFELREFRRAEDAIATGLFPVVWIDRGELPDVRFAIGCQVHVHAPSWSPELLALGEAIADAGAKSVVVNAIEESPDLMIYENGEWRTA